MSGALDGDARKNNAQMKVLRPAKLSIAQEPFFLFFFFCYPRSREENLSLGLIKHNCHFLPRSLKYVQPKHDTPAMEAGSMKDGHYLSAALQMPRRGKRAYGERR